MPRLRVLAGPSLEELTHVDVNSGQAVDVSSDAFHGRVAVFIHEFPDEDGKIKDSEYFSRRKNVSWSIQMQGRFLGEYSADDVLFGNVFERPLKLPWGFSAAVRFMGFIDPTLEHDLASSSMPWALSPLISTMPYFAHKRVADGTAHPSFPPETPTQDDVSQLRSSAGKGSSPGQRRSHFKKAPRRQEVVFGPEDLITADFCYDFLRFSADGVTLQLPGGISIPMMKYWDGQPVQFVCCERVRGGGNGGKPWGRVLWCVVIERVDDDATSVLEKP